MLHCFSPPVLPFFRRHGAVCPDWPIRFVNKIDEKFLQNFFSFYEDESRCFGKRTGQKSRKIFLHFQNGSFYIAKWPILLGKMIHLGK
jgi:hypothetical protein